MEDECTTCGCNGSDCSGCHGADPRKEAAYTDDEIDDIEVIYYSHILSSRLRR